MLVRESLVFNQSYLVVKQSTTIVTIRQQIETTHDSIEAKDQLAFWSLLQHAG